MDQTNAATFTHVRKDSPDHHARMCRRRETSSAFEFRREVVTRVTWASPDRFLTSAHNFGIWPDDFFDMLQHGGNVPDFHPPSNDLQCHFTHDWIDRPAIVHGNHQLIAILPVIFTLINV